ncbi:MAG: cytidylate kinase-like family protein [Acidobacteriota bacterium]|jgi:cytidylate kinase|nr:cytidylate kinase-like family protein [Acidobacteriota bacterium]
MEHLEPFITTRLSETQMRWWNVLHPVEQAQASPYQFLTISRDIGTPGDEIAGELAMRQGWRVYDKEIVDHIANNSRVREDMVRQLDEKTRGRMHNMILRMLRMPEEAPFGHEEYHDSLMKTLATLAARGDAILVGRGANFALRWVEHGLHVRITGSLEKRIQTLSRLWQVSSEIARRRVFTIDAERRAFIRHHFKQDVNDLSFYSLVLNTDDISTKQAVGLILAALNPE